MNHETKFFNRLHTEEGKFYVNAFSTRMLNLFTEFHKFDRNLVCVFDNGVVW